MPAYLGQHFLADPEAARRIAAALDARKDDLVVEIGPGRGALTRWLAATPAKLMAVELDQRFLAALERDFAGRIEVKHADFLEWDLDRGLPEGGPVKFAGNLPYAVAAPILQKVLAWPRTHSAVFMFQKEVAERLTAEPGTRDYGLLTLTAALLSERELVLQVPKAAFRPPPKVDSAVVRFHRRPYPLPAGVTAEAVLGLAKAAFSERRKQIVNPLARVRALSKERVTAALRAAGIEPSARAEQVPLDGYIALARALA